MTKSSSALKWSFLDTYANFFTKFIFVIIITRILTPKDYGLIAYMGLFLGIATWLSEGGFGSALIQKQDVNNKDFSTAFFFNAAVSLFFFILYFFIAGFVSDFFNEPDLKKVMRITSLNIVLNSLCYIHLIKLIKAVDFKPQALINFSSSVLSGIIGLIMAVSGFHYWALVIQTLIGTFLRMIGLIAVVRWTPAIVFDLNSFKHLFRFGSRVFILGLMESIFREVNSLVIGKTYKTYSLGLYSRGQKFFDIFIIQPGIALNKVIFPLFSTIASDDEGHKRNYFRFYSLIFFILAPVCLILFLLADPLVSTFLTDKWLGAVPFMKLYFLSGVAYILLYFNSTTLMSFNRPGLCLKLDIIQKTFLILALFLTYKISILAIVAGWLLVYYIQYIIYELFMSHLGFTNSLKYKQMGQVILGLVPILLVHIIIIQIFDNNLVLFVLQGFILPITYLLFFKFTHLSVYILFTDNIRSLLPKSLQNFL